jgi:uncharacterized protein YjbI with pentapeptide repeats
VGDLSQVNLEEMEISDERIELGPDVYFLGPHLILRRCTLVLKIAARNLVIPSAQFIGCAFEAKRALKEFRWHRSQLKGCRFNGRFSGNDFGEDPDSPGQGSIEDCDFTEATLQGCRFMGCDVGTLRFPAWPCFTLLEPVRRQQELRTYPWPGSMGQITIAGLELSPVTTTAVTFSALVLAERHGTTPEAIKAVLEKLDGVFY